MKAVPAQVALCSACGTTLSPKGQCLPCLVRAGFDGPAQLPIPAAFGGYEIARREDGSLCELGRGAMGITYRAVDKVLRRSVALKVIEISQASGNGQMVRDRFLREARAAAALHHPSVAGVFQFGVTGESERCYYAMELVEGETLEALVRREGPLNTDAALNVAVQVAQALVAAAAHDLIHRDLKPGNIMLKQHGSELEVKVIDFGLAKVLAESGNDMDLTHGGFIGTPAFASPEQFSDAPADARSDIYSLGATIWYALTGEVPHPGRTLDEIRRSQSELPLPVEKLLSRKVPKPLIQLLQRVLSVDPAQRPRSARELMTALEQCRAQPAHPRPNEWRVWRQPRTLIALAGFLALGAATLFTLRLSGLKKAEPLLAPPKSIAVLPFENMSDDKTNIYFADGVQEEILTTLAKVADLKVISRTSVMGYSPNAHRDLREIGEALCVAYVLEGSVRRAGGRVRVTAQLIDVQTNTHLWAESYDRDLADVFAIQTEIAQQITTELKAKLSAPEKTAIEERPTKDLAAFDLYTRARTLRLSTAFSAPAMNSLLQGVELLDDAVARDPTFLLAWCELATVHDLLYFGGSDHTAARLALADKAVQTALALRPDAGEAHLALAQHLYWGYLDYDRARAELDIARRTLPNNAQVFALTGYIDRRQGRWAESTRSLERALELDPRNWFILRQIGLSYRNLRRYPERAAVLDRALAIVPDDVTTRVARAEVALQWQADSRPLQATLEALLAEDPTVAPKIADDAMFLALCQRDFSAANRALTHFGSDRVQSSTGWLSRAFWEGVAARTRGDAAAANAAFTIARAEQEVALRAQPDYAAVLCLLGLIDAGLGRKEDALREGRRALELLPLERDALDGADMIEYFAIICAWTGEKELAFQQLQKVTRIPSSLSYGQLKLSPFWDPLRGDPRFEEIVASLAPH